jgi:hypothetical protein
MIHKLKTFLNLVNTNQSFGKVAEQTKMLLDVGEKGRFLINCSKIMETWRLKEIVEKNPNLIDFYFKHEKLDKNICYSPLSQILKMAGPYGDEQVLYLIEKGADINRVANIEGKSPLILAFNYHYFSVVEKMISLGVDVNILDNEKNNCLLHFFKHSYLLNDDSYFSKLNKMVSLLHKNNFNFSQTDKEGNNVLFYMVYHQPNNTELLNTLIEYGVNPYHKNNNGQNFIDFYEKGVRARECKQMGRFGKIIPLIKEEKNLIIETLKEKLMLEEITNEIPIKKNIKPVKI